MIEEAADPYPATMRKELRREVEGCHRRIDLLKENLRFFEEQCLRYEKMFAHVDHIEMDNGRRVMRRDSPSQNWWWECEEDETSIVSPSVLDVYEKGPPSDD